MKYDESVISYFVLFLANDVGPTSICIFFSSGKFEFSAFVVTLTLSLLCCFSVAFDCDAKSSSSSFLVDSLSSGKSGIPTP